MDGWGIWIDRIAILALLLSPIGALLLFFARTPRIQRVILRTVASLLTINFATLFLGEMGWCFKCFEPTFFVRSLGWFFRGMRTMWIFYAAIGAICGIGYWVSKRRISRREKPDAFHPSSHPIQEAVPAFGIGKIFSIVCTSLFAIGMLAFAREVIIERYRYGIPIDMAAADYGACICYNHESLIITVDKNGGISNSKGMLGLAGFQALLKETLADKPRFTNVYVDMGGNTSSQEYVAEIAIHLRVDRRCSYRNLRRVLEILNDQNIRWVYFRVSERN